MLSVQMVQAVQIVQTVEIKTPLTNSGFTSNRITMSFIGSSPTVGRTVERRRLKSAF
jgi:hypothetical protein